MVIAGFGEYSVGVAAIVRIGFASDVAPLLQPGDQVRQPRQLGVVCCVSMSWGAPVGEDEPAPTISGAARGAGLWRAGRGKRRGPARPL
jgi:hypothetical protein